jgi:hypothetical protein
MLLATTAAGAGFLPGTASASGGIRIHFIYFDSPGADTGTNASLNAEYITLKKTAANAIQLKGWTVRDDDGHVYKFKTRFKLYSGARVKIHTGNGTNTRKNRYWGADNYVWNNTGDKAILKKPSVVTVDTCQYSGTGSYVSC